MALLQQEESSEADVEEMVENAPMSLGDPVAFLAAASVLFSWYLFYMKQDKDSGIFVGLWAPTLLTAANYVQQKHFIQKLKRGLTS